MLITTGQIVRNPNPPMALSSLSRTLFLGAASNSSRSRVRNEVIKDRIFFLAHNEEYHSKNIRNQFNAFFRLEKTTISHWLCNTFSVFHKISWLFPQHFPFSILHAVHSHIGLPLCQVQGIEAQLLDGAVNLVVFGIPHGGVPRL
jgi:hypothetical protein